MEKTVYARWRWASELEGKDTVGGSHTNYLRKRFFKYQLGFSSQSLDYAVASVFSLGKGINFVTRQVKSSGRTASPGRLATFYRQRFLPLYLFSSS